MNTPGRPPGPARVPVGSPNEYVDYAASKGALEAFTTGLAKEVARAILWLAGAEAPFVTGTFLDVTGGK